MFYHFTSASHLLGIDDHGLTVGDIPTDLELNTGEVGVWLTSNPSPAGHGLQGSAVDKTEIRLSVRIDDYRPLKHWEEWAALYTTPETVRSLKKADGRKYKSWFIYLGWVPSDAVLEAVSMRTGQVIEDWDAYVGDRPSLPGVPFWQRDDWHRRLLAQAAQVKAQVAVA
jgi:hypothetical protein